MEMGQTMRGLGGPGRGLGFLMCALGSRGCEQGRGADVQFNRTLLAALCEGWGWGVWRRLTAGDWEGSWRSGRSWAEGMVSTQWRFSKHLGKDPKAHEGSVLGKSKDPGLRHHWEKQSWIQSPGRTIGQYPSSYFDQQFHFKKLCE